MLAEASTLIAEVAPTGFSAESLLQLLVGSTGGIAALLLGLRWLNSDRDKLMQALTTERDARIKVLEEAAKRCADDRLVMHKEMSILQEEVRELYKRIAAIVAGDVDPKTHTGRVHLMKPFNRSNDNEEVRE